MASAADSIRNSTRERKLDEKWLASVRVEKGERIEFKDVIVPQLRVRASATSKNWTLVYRVAGAGEGGKKGKMSRMSLGDYPRVTIARARELARSALESAERGVDPAHQRREDAVSRNERVFETVAERFVDEYAKREQKEWRSTKSYLDRYVVPKWKGRPIDEIRRGDVSAVLAAARTTAIANARERAEKAGRPRSDARHELSGTSAAREVRKHLRKLFNWALMEDLVEFNPALGDRPELAYTKRDRVLTVPELRRIWDGAVELGFPFGDITRLLILTGQRRSEVAELPEEWLDRKAKLVVIPREHYKTGREHAYPLSKPAAAIIDAVPRTGESRFLFPASRTMRPVAEGANETLRPVSGFSKAKLRLDKIIAKHDAKEGRKPLAPWTLHDIRRSVATGLAELGVPGDHIERVLGHILGGVREVYNQYPYLDEKRAALDAWGKLWK